MARLLLRLVLVLLATGIAWLGVLAWALHPPDPLPAAERGFVLPRVTLVEPGAGRRTGVRVVVAGGRIAAIEPARPGDAGAFADATVLPGLSDLHVHPPMVGLPGDLEYTALQLLAHGITTARMLGGMEAPDRDVWAARVRDGALPGPRWLTCGPILDGANPLLPGSRSVAGADAARSPPSPRRASTASRPTTASTRRR